MKPKPIVPKADDAKPPAEPAAVADRRKVVAEDSEDEAGTYARLQSDDDTGESDTGSGGGLPREKIHEDDTA